MVKKKGGAAKGKQQVSDDEYEPAPVAEDLNGSAAFNVDEEGNDLGGLMSLMAAASKKGGAKKGKKARKAVDDDEYDVEPVQTEDAGSVAKEDEEPAPAKGKAAAQKGGKGGKPALADDPEEEIRKLAAELEASALSAKAAPAKKAGGAKQTAPKAKAAADSDNESSEDDASAGPKSKKQKEKERKARQAAAKKAATGTSKAPAKAAAEPESPAEVKEEQAGTESKEDAAGKKKKKGPAGIGQLKQLLELQRKAEEEARRLEEEERKRIEEEEKRLEEEERKKEEAKRLKKEKEKAKKEELKKQGKYLTKAQKEAQAKTQIRNAQLLQLQGVKVAALAGEGGEGVSPSSDAPPKKPRVVYDNRRKKQQPQQQQVRETAPSPKPSEPESVEMEAEPVETPITEVSTPVADESAVKASWDDASEEEGIKDNWDDESETEKEKEKAAAATSASISASANQVSSKAPARKDEEASESEDEEDEEEEESSSEEEPVPKRGAKGKAAAKPAAPKDDEEDKELRSPIFVVLGHVDAGKTKLLDKIRQTNVQEGEAGGITQQIGATYFPIDAIKSKTTMLRTDGYEYKVPGLLGIDTPGHESFTNLRSRGSSLCNIAILVVDIFNGLEPQTIESLNLLKRGKTPFVVAVNKVDRLYGWKSTPNNAIQDSFKDQPLNVVQEFETRMQRIVTQFAEQGLNAVLYYENTNFARNVSLVPTSAQTGEGVPDLLNLVVKLTQERMTKSLMYLSDLEATVLEVKVIEGLGTTIDVILSNGVLNEGDRIVVCGLNGPIVTTIRALLTPQPMREIRVKSAYVHHKQVKAALGVKIAANDLDKAIAGSRLLVVGPDDDEDDLKEEVQQDLIGLLSVIDKSGKGVCVQASTLGSLEALLSFLQDSKIPVSGINIGPVHKKDVIRASVMLERAREYAQILAFDVKIDKDAEDLAEEVGVKIFQADVIYRLFDQFKAYMAEITEAKRRDQAPQAVFPCMLKIVPGAVFNKRNPIVIGVDVIEGQLRLGTPLAAVTADRGVVPLGKVTSIELNHKAREVIKKGEPAVAIKIECPQYETPKFVGRHFTEKDGLISHISRQSIDVLKSTFRDDVSKEEWATIIKLKKILHID